jgi:hypothetical protein
MMRRRKDADQRPSCVEYHMLPLLPDGVGSTVIGKLNGKKMTVDLPPGRYIYEDRPQQTPSGAYFIVAKKVS